MYEVVRGAHDPSAGTGRPHNVFTRAPFFHQWQLEDRVFERT